MTDIIEQEHSSSQIDRVKSIGLDITDLPTMTPEKIAKIADKMVEIDRGINTLGKKNTQTTVQLMTLTMLTDSPYRRLRQCITEIKHTRDALSEHYFRFKKEKLKVEKWREEAAKGDELASIEIEQATHNFNEARVYIEGALKEIGVLQVAYDEIRKNNNISENWDELDAELDEIRHHIRQVFRQAHRDFLLTGGITQGNAEYFEQYGIHLQTARNVIVKYIATCEKLLEEGKAPNINHFYEFLDHCVEIFGDEYKNVMKHIGLEGIIKQEFLYRSTK